MTIILPKVQKQPSTGERFGNAFASASQYGAQSIPEHFVRQQQDRAEIEAIKNLTGKDLSGLNPELRKTFAERLAKSPEHEKIREALIANGVDEKDADLYTLLTQGGQTAFVKDILDKKKRESNISGQFSKKENESDQFDWESELEDVVSSQDQGVTPAERVKLSSERYKTGQPLREESLKKLHTSSRNKERFDVLESLSKSNKLPKDLGRINVDKEGNLRLPFASSPEAQRWVKTINEFASGAKDTYGSRVTNFDLAQYLKQFPNLLNSKEGVSQILQQLRIVNDINSTYYKNLQDVYRKAGGARKIDADQAMDIAERRSDPEIQKLQERFKSIGKFTSVPAASEFQGRTIRNPETGEKLKSDGKNWIPVEGE